MKRLTAGSTPSAVDLATAVLAVLVTGFFRVGLMAEGLLKQYRQPQMATA